jgi:hypothetical protein
VRDFDDGVVVFATSRERAARTRDYVTQRNEITASIRPLPRTRDLVT